LAGAFLVGALVALLAWRGVAPGEPDRFTATSAPPLSDPRADRLFDEAWRALLAADVPRALRDLRALALEEPGSVDLHLAMILANHLLDPRSGALEQGHDPRWDPAELQGYQREVVLALRAAAPREALERWLQQAPSDALTRLLVATHQGRSEPDAALATLAPFGELPLALVLRTRILEWAGRAEEAEAMARAAPGAGWVEATRAEDHLMAQRWAAAEGAARRALSREPGLSQARGCLGEALVRSGQMDEAAALARRMEDPLVPAQDRIRFMERYAVALSEVGHLDRALESVELTFQALGAEAGAASVDRLLLLGLSLEEAAGSYPPSAERLEALRQRALLPGVPPPVRAHVQQVLLLTEAEQAVAAGDLARADALTQHLEVGWAARVTTARALSQGQVAPDLAEDCLGGVLAVRWLRRFGRRAEEEALLLALHGQQVCAAYGYQRSFGAEVALSAAELLAARGEAGGAAQALAQAAAYWPYPQPGGDQASRREALQRALTAGSAAGG
jgi:hypothetical protein